MTEFQCVDKVWEMYLVMNCLVVVRAGNHRRDGALGSDVKKQVSREPLVFRFSSLRTDRTTWK